MTGAIIVHQRMTGITLPYFHLAPELIVESGKRPARPAGSLIEEVRLVPENERLEIELAGDLAGILALSNGDKKPVTAVGDGARGMVVAGTGFEPVTFRL